MQSLAKELIEKLKAASLNAAAAESCTCGLVADTFARIPGASAVFWGSFVCYTEDAKQKMLGVAPETLRRYGAVSEETAREMCLGALEKSGADTAVSVTGLAGPDGDGSDNPVGTVWICAARRGKPERTSLRHFDGNRASIRAAAAQAAAEMLLAVL